MGYFQHFSESPFRNNTNKERCECQCLKLPAKGADHSDTLELNVMAVLKTKKVCFKPLIQIYIHTEYTDQA